MGISNTFSRSWEITKLSFRVIKKDKEILIFPVISFILIVLFWLIMLIPIIISIFFNDATFGLLQYFILFTLYLGTSVISTFFSVAVIYTAKKRFEGGNASFLESIGAAFSRIHYIILWGIVSATIGVIFYILEKTAEKSRGFGRLFLRILNSILGLAWSIATIFVIQVITYEKTDPFNAIKISVLTLKKTWGESIIKYIGLGVTEFLFLIIGLVIGMISIFFFCYFRICSRNYSNDINYLDLFYFNNNYI